MKVTDKDYIKAREYFGVSASWLRVELSEYIDKMEKGDASWSWFLEKTLAVLYKLMRGREEWKKKYWQLKK